jgi:hypothetical protein
MKDQILKLAGVKTEKEFYKKYPTEEAFMKVHGKAFKKAAMGTSMVKDQLQQLTDFGNPPIAYGGINTPGGGGWHSEWEDDPSNPYNLQNVGNLMPKNNFGNISSKEMKGIQGSLKGIMGAANQGAASQGMAGAVGGAKANLSKGLGPASSYIQPAMDLIEGFGMIGQQNDAELYTKLTGVQAQAAALRPEPINRKYVRPEDTIIQPGQMFPNYGVGTNILAAEDGATIGGNPGEIQNTYDPYNLYDDLGYEPLNDSNKLKSYQLGGDIGQGGFGDFMNEGGSDLLNNLTNLTYGKRGPSAGNQIGKGLGTAAGTAFLGPVGGMVGRALGSVVGGLFDNTGEKLDAFENQTGSNMNSVMGQKFGRGFQQQFGLKDGGYVSNDWTPQLITKFGEYDVEDLLKPPHDADMLRAGGNIRGGYTPPSQRALQTYAMGGDVSNSNLGEVVVESGGYLEPISYNPFNDGTGVTSMIRGQRHEDYSSKLGHSGVILNAYGNRVEAETGEPIREMEEGGSLGNDKSAVVTGNLVYKDLSGTPDSRYKKYEGKKIKNIHKEIALRDKKLNKKEEKNTNKLLDLDPTTPIEKLEESSLAANKLGYMMQYAANSTDANYFTNHQSIINDASKKNGLYPGSPKLIADLLAKGIVKPDTSKDTTAKYGVTIPKAKYGINLSKAKDGDEYGLTPWTGNKAKGNKYGKRTASSFTLDEWNKVARNLGFEGKGNKEFQEFLLNDPRSAPLIKARHKELYGTEPFVDDRLGYGYAAKELLTPTLGPLQNLPMKRINIDKMKVPSFSGVGETKKAKDKNEFPWMQVANQLIPYLRPTDGEQLDPSQLSGEMYALSNNQLEPVQAQTYQPQLSTPYDISYQDVLNANQSDFNAMQRQMGYNPEAQSALAAQKYAANEKVLGEQFRANQAEKQRVYEGNRNILNDAQLRNLATLDQQYTRQEQAKSNTKNTTQAALSSISSKIAQNKLDNRTLATMENLYNYRFDPKFRAKNMNPLVDFDQMIASASPNDLTAMATKINEKAKKPTAGNGSIVKAMKDL